MTKTTGLRALVQARRAAEDQEWAHVRDCRVCIRREAHITGSVKGCAKQQRLAAVVNAATDAVEEHRARREGWAS